MRFYLKENKIMIYGFVDNAAFVAIHGPLVLVSMAAETVRVVAPLPEYDDIATLQWLLDGAEGDSHVWHEKIVAHTQPQSWAPASFRCHEALRTFALQRQRLASRPTIHDVAAQAYQAQDAVNLAGLVRSWAEWMPVVCAHERETGIAQNHHPVNVIMVDKLAQLTGMVVESTKPLDAMGVVRRLADLP